MDALSTAKQIYTLARAIYDQAQKVKANQAQCRLLADRVTAIESAIKKLGQLPNDEAFCRSLTRLNAGLSEIHYYMKELSSASWFRRFLNARSHEATFQGFNQRLTLAISELSLGLDAQALINREADQKAAQADHAMLLSQQAEIIRLNEAMLQHLNKVADQGFHQRQHDSMKGRLDQLLRLVGEIKSPSAALDAKITIPYFELTLEEKLGCGAFGAIYRGLWHEKVVAIKVWEGRLSEREQAQFIQEIQALERIKSPSYVPQFYGACLEAHQACLVLEYCPLGSLDTVLARQRLSPAQQRTVAISLAKSLQFLHRQHIVHRYLKSANVLLTEDKPGAPLQAKITGFGLSKTHYPSIVSAQLNLDALKVGLAPEVLSGKETTSAADVYSFGVIVWEILTGRPALASMALNQEYDPAYTALIQRCWSPDPKQRPSMNDIILTLTALSPPIPPTIPAVQLLSSVMASPPLSPELKKPLEVRIPDSPAAATPPSPSAYEQARQYHAQKDYGHARACYESALAAGEDKARVKLATLLMRGNGGQPGTLKADQARAVVLLQQAAEKNDLLAMKNLVKALQHGIGTPVDAKAAAKWQRRMAAFSPPAVQNPSLSPVVTPRFHSALDNPPSQSPAVNVFARRATPPASSADSAIPKLGS